MRASSESHVVAHRAMAAAADQGRLSLGADTRRLNRPGSPVFNLLENAIFPVGGIALFAAFTIAYGGGGAIVGAVALGISLILRRFWIRSVMPNRIADRALHDPDLFARLWAHGGLSLMLNDGSGETCTSPDEDWDRFVRAHFPDARLHH